jgi:hypothetical protein
MFIFYSFGLIVRWSYNRLVRLAGKPQWAQERDNLPHPLMVILACFMAVRFAYLG